MPSSRSMPTGRRLDAKTLERIDQVMIRLDEANLPEAFPLRVVRPDNDSLAFVTSTGHLFILKGSLLAP